MGNQITGTVPTQILPLESYFNELQEYSKPHRLENIVILYKAHRYFWQSAFANVYKPTPSELHLLCV